MYEYCQANIVLSDCNSALMMVSRRVLVAQSVIVIRIIC